MPYLCDLEGNVYFEIEKISIFLCQKYYDKNGKLCEKEVLKTGVDEVYVPGDTTAQIFWLKNRKPQDWRDKQERIDNTMEDNDMVKQYIEGMKQRDKTK